MMEVWDSPTPWKKKQAKWCIPDLEASIKIFCCECNQEKVWHEGNDCVSTMCSLFPFRPGAQNPEVAGVKRAARKEVSERQRKSAQENAIKNFSPRQPTVKVSQNTAREVETDTGTSIVKAYKKKFFT